jgi:hypothetical protein
MHIDTQPQLPLLDPQARTASSQHHSHPQVLTLHRPYQQAVGAVGAADAGAADAGAVGAAAADAERRRLD